MLEVLFDAVDHWDIDDVDEGLSNVVEVSWIVGIILVELVVLLQLSLLKCGDIAMRTLLIGLFDLSLEHQA